MLGLAGQHRVGQVDHGGPVLLPVHLVQQLAGARQVPARGGLQHASQYVEGVVSAVQAEQRAHAGLGQDQQRAGLLGQGRRAFVRLGGAAVGSRGQGHAGHALSTGGAALDRALQHLVGQLQGHDVAACVAQQVQQVGLVEEPRGRRGLDATADRLLGLVHVAQTEQGPDTTPQGGQHADEIDPDLDRFALRVSGEHVGGEVPGARGGAHVALDRRGQQLIGQLQRGRVAAVLVEQVQQEGHLEAPAPDRVVEAAPDPVLALVLPGQGEQRPGLELCALVLAGIDGQGLLRILQREVRFSSFEVELGQGVVYGVAEVST